MSEQPPPPPPYGQASGGQHYPPYPPYAGYPPPRFPQTSGKAVVALVLGVCALSLGPFTGIPAIFVGHSAKREIDASGGRLDGRGLAQAGFVLGLIMTVLSVLALIGLVLLIVVVASVDQGAGTGDLLLAR